MQVQLPEAGVEGRLELSDELAVAIDEPLRPIIQHVQRKPIADLQEVLEIWVLLRSRHDRLKKVHVGTLHSIHQKRMVFPLHQTDWISRGVEFFHPYEPNDTSRSLGPILILMSISFYIDESGHSGDVVNTGTAYDFLDQPYFVLAALGIEDEASLAQQIDALRVAHRVPEGVLKSKSKSLQSRPDFIYDLLSFVCDQELPLFIEVVDKRFFVCIQLIESQLLPPAMGFEDGPEMHFIKNTLVDFLYDEISDHVLDRFVAACTEPSDLSLMSAFGSQLLFSAGKSATSDAQDIRTGMHHMVIEAMKKYVEMRKQDPNAYLRFLPSPDLNKRGKKVWMLPNLSSLTNIYARINLFRQRKLANVRLVHDRQMELDDILRNAKREAESIIKDTKNKPFTPHSDYVFLESAPLEFAKSHESLGIQVADVIAGTVMRFYRDRLRGNAADALETAEAVQKLLSRSDASTGIGVNQVVPQRFVL